MTMYRIAYCYHSADFYEVETDDLERAFDAVAHHVMNQQTDPALPPIAVVEQNTCLGFERYRIWALDAEGAWEEVETE